MSPSDLPAPPQTAVLILADDALVGALLAMMIEALGMRPVPVPHDAAALRRPGALADARVLVDCDHEVARSGELDELCRDVRCRVVLFSARRTEREMAAVARERGREAFALPIGVDALARVLDLPPRRRPGTGALADHRAGADRGETAGSGPEA